MRIYHCLRVLRRFWWFLGSWLGSFTHFLSAVGSVNHGCALYFPCLGRSTGCSRVAQNETPGLPPMGSGQWNVACRMLVPRPGIKPSPAAVEAQNLNHWTARKVPEKGLSSLSPNMMKLWPLIWLTSAYICLCLRERNRQRQMLAWKKRTSFNNKPMGANRPFGLSLFQMSKLRQWDQAVLASSHSQPATEPGSDLRGPASLDTNCKSQVSKTTLGLSNLLQGITELTERCYTHSYSLFLGKDRD